jgi:predicted nucleic acid-binding protein
LTPTSSCTATIPAKQRRAQDLVERGASDGDLRIPYQALIELVRAATRPQRDGSSPILTLQAVLAEVEDWLLVAPILYPDEELLRTAARGTMTYQLSWFDALIWAFADRHAIGTLYSEDFQHGRRYGRTTVIDPFR